MYPVLLFDMSCKMFLRQKSVVRNLPAIHSLVFFDKFHMIKKSKKKKRIHQLLKKAATEKNLSYHSFSAGLKIKYL